MHFWRWWESHPNCSEITGLPTSGEGDASFLNLFEFWSEISKNKTTQSISMFDSSLMYGNKHKMLNWKSVWSPSCKVSFHQQPLLHGFVPTWATVPYPLESIIILPTFKIIYMYIYIYHILNGKSVNPQCSDISNCHSGCISHHISIVPSQMIFWMMIIPYILDIVG
jgi:hypothetical protein